MSPRNQLSPPCDSSREGHRRGRAATLLSRSSLGLLALATATPACLVTSTPDFTPPKQTAPILIPATADPDPRTVVIGDSAQQKFSFSAHVRISEYDVDQVRFKLFVDYGATDNLDDRLPYRFAAAIQPLDPNEVPDPAKRVVQALWFPASSSSGPGCHNVTLIASHAFDDVPGCPVCKNDSSQITWQVYLCNGPPPCMTDFTECQAWTRSCPDAPETASSNQCGASP